MVERIFSCSETEDLLNSNIVFSLYTALLVPISNASSWASVAPNPASNVTESAIEAANCFCELLPAVIACPSISLTFKSAMSVSFFAALAAWTPT